MEAVKSYLKTKHNLSSYQIAQITFLFKSLGSELSKLLLMGLLFHDRLGMYLFALAVMMCLRCSTGGLHFYTYIGCLAASVLYLWMSIYLLPHVEIMMALKLVLLSVCIFICHYIGPVTSKYRPAFTSAQLKRYSAFTCRFIFFFALGTYIIPENPYMIIGFWVIILHSIQLIMGKIRKKGVENK